MKYIKGMLRKPQLIGLQSNWVSYYMSHNKLDEPSKTVGKNPAPMFEMIKTFSTVDVSELKQL